MAEFFPLHVHDHYSLLDGLSKPKQIAERCTNLGYTGSGITNHGSISGAISFIKAMEKAKRKWILGNEFYLSASDPSIKTPENRKLAHLCVLARNMDGWKSLVKATSESNKMENFYYKPRLKLDDFSKFAGNLVCFSGHPGSEMCNILFKDMAAAYEAESVDQARMILKDDWEQQAVALAGKYQDIFGKGNFYIEIQLIDASRLGVAVVIAECLRKVSKLTGIPCVATCDAHYPSKQDAPDQRVILASSLQTTLGAIHKKMAASEEFGLSGFFKSNNYHIPSLEEMEALHKGYEHELRASVEIADSCEMYNLASKPMIPNFKTPEGMSQDEYFKRLCEEGWNKKIASRIDGSEHQKYRDRLEYELGVLMGAGLSGYFNVVHDYISFARKNGWLVGPGRGSAAGCLASYLSGITAINPIPYDLLFERFYNAGRNTATRVSLPDIDTDFRIQDRQAIIEYIKQSYGLGCVAQIATFGRMQGRSSIKEVLRAHEACSYDTMNEITDHIPDEARIADELQEMKESGEEPSIIKWALENNGDKLKEWCVLKEDGTCEGPMSRLFEQAIRLEGTYKSSGKHAAGVVISPTPLNEVCPMMYDKKTNSEMTAMEYEDLEYMGIAKFDILGVASLDKVQGCINILKTGRVNG